MKNKKNTFKAAILIFIFILLVSFGIVSYTYDSLSPEEQTTNTQQYDDDDDENIFFKYMHNIYNRLSYDDV